MIVEGGDGLGGAAFGEPAKPLAAHLLSGDLWGGAEAQVFHLIGALLRGGRWEARVILLNDGLAAERLRRAGTRVRVLPERGRSFLSLLRDCGRILREWNPRIVHSHGYKENLLAGFAARPLRGCARIRTQHGSPYPGGRFPYTAYYRVDRFLAPRLCERAIAVSGAVAEEMRRFLPMEKIATVRNGIPLPEEAGGAPPPENPGPGRWIVSCGRLSPEKRFDRLIDAVARLAEEGIDARLLLVGDGPERGALERIAGEIAPGRVRFAGFREEPAPLLGGAEIFALSSEREGLPMTLLEALALGLPAVVPRVGGMAEVIRDGETGLLVPPGDGPALAAAIARLLRDDSLRGRIGAAGKEAVRREYGVDRTARETERVYEEATRR
ncbi:MAG: glycosyltransferase [Candidatus Eisenbacteria bacterium]|nr:glycosyltransferase [Candidatus Eisenbacteria bacterium]